jgi:hypothetical protein
VGLAAGLIVNLIAQPALADPDDAAIKPVKLAIEIQHKLGLATQPLAAARRAGVINGYMRVLDCGPLAQLDSDIAVAETMARASAAEASRARALNAADQSVSAKTLEGALAQSDADAAKLALLRRRLSLEWGVGLGRLSTQQRAALLAQIGAGKAALVRIDTASGLGLADLHAVDIDLGPLGSVRASVLGPARAADPHLLSSGVIAKASGAHMGALAVGLSVPVKLTVSAPVSGVLAPRSALVRSQGKTWLYVRTSADTFQREPVDDGKPESDGVFVPTGLRPGQPVVTQGSAALFAAETNIGDDGGD